MTPQNFFTLFLSVISYPLIFVGTVWFISIPVLSAVWGESKGVLHWAVVTAGMSCYFLLSRFRPVLEPSERILLIRRVLIFWSISYLLLYAVLHVYRNTIWEIERAGFINEYAPFWHVEPYFVSLMVWLTSIVIGWAVWNWTKRKHLRLHKSIAVFALLGFAYLHVGCLLFYYSKIHMYQAFWSIVSVAVSAYLIDWWCGFLLKRYPKAGGIFSQFCFTLTCLLLALNIWNNSFASPQVSPYQTRAQSIPLKEGLKLLANAYKRNNSKGMAAQLKLARNGNADAMRGLAETYESLSEPGGVSYYFPFTGYAEPPFQYARAQEAYWLHQAASKGVVAGTEFANLYMEGYKPDSFFHLFLSFYNLGIPYNPEEAYYWVLSTDCDPSTQSICPDAKKLLTVDQIAKVEKRVEEDKKSLLAHDE